MITLPLSAVVTYLTRKGAGLGCLEGAPMLFFEDADPEDHWQPNLLYGLGADRLDNFAWMNAQVGPAIHASMIADCRWHLYLGSGPVCPAAMGWASEVLRTTCHVHQREPLWLGVGFESVTLGRFMQVIGCWLWIREHRIPDGRRPPEQRLFTGNPPPTPAARLKAVLEYEMGRA